MALLDKRTHDIFIMVSMYIQYTLYHKVYVCTQKTNSQVISDRKVMESKKVRSSKQMCFSYLSNKTKEINPKTDFFLSGKEKIIKLLSYL